jgi:hypothetical protein
MKLYKKQKGLSIRKGISRYPVDFNKAYGAIYLKKNSIQYKKKIIIITFLQKHKMQKNIE